MDKSFLPQAYVENSLCRIFLFHFSAPLVPQNIQNKFRKTPYEIFDEFNANSVNAASIVSSEEQQKTCSKDTVQEYLMYLL
jgi:hypothetical protein